MEGVRAQFKNTTKLARWSGGPEAEFLHERRLLAGDELLKLSVKLGKIGVVLNRMEGLVVTRVALVFPDVHYSA